MTDIQIGTNLKSLIVPFRSTTGGADDEQRV
jgi:hypothetical protein